MHALQSYQPLVSNIVTLCSFDLFSRLRLQETLAVRMSRWLASFSSRRVKNTFCEFPSVHPIRKPTCVKSTRGWCCIKKCLSWHFNTDACARLHACVQARTRSKRSVDSRRVLQMSPGLGDIGGVQWQLALCLLFVWAVEFVVLIKGIASLGKVSSWPLLQIDCVPTRGVVLICRPRPVQMSREYTWLCLI